MTANTIEQMIEQMTPDEQRQRLAAYMAADPLLSPRPVAVGVRPAGTGSTRCRYDIVLIAADGRETPIRFRDRCSRLVYLYTLLHPQGYQRRQATVSNYKALRQLYAMLYFKEGQSLLNTIASTGFDHFFSHYVAQSRKAVRQATPHADLFAIDRPQSHEGRVLIPFVARGGTVILDDSLRNQMSHL